jgi:hypothetical protein
MITCRATVVHRCDRPTRAGVDPAALAAWFHLSFVDGYDWVMTTNVVGRSQHADGGLITPDELRTEVRRRGTQPP